MKIAKLCVFVGLLLGFSLLFQRIRVLSVVKMVWKQTKAGMDEAARQRILTNRKNLLLMETEHSWWFRLERILVFSGWKRRLPMLTAEQWIAGNVVMVSVLFLASLTIIGRWQISLLVAGGGVLLEYIFLKWCQGKEFRMVNNNLLKFLDFLGNYSITAGEVTSIFYQISRYMDEPLRSVLVECYYEAQTTGDVSLALLSMTEKIEHPMFQEIVRNIEVSVRYCADFTLLVSNSRRSVREFLRTGEERSGMLREAMINMLLLTGMSLLAFLLVDELVEVSIWQVLWDTMVGRVALIAIVIIFGLFSRKIYEMNR